MSFSDSYFFLFCLCSFKKSQRILSNIYRRANTYPSQMIPKELQRKKCFRNYFMKTALSLNKTGQRCHKKAHNWPISLINICAKILKKKNWQIEVNSTLKVSDRASLVAQRLRICLPMQGTRVRALVWEDPTCCGATRPVSHNCWACVSGACAPQQERPR